METSELNKLASSNIEQIVLAHGSNMQPHNALFNKCVGLTFKMNVKPKFSFKGDEEKEFEREFSIMLRYGSDGYKSFVFGSDDVWSNFKMLSDEKIERLCNQLAIKFDRTDLMVGSFMG